MSQISRTPNEFETQPAVDPAIGALIDTNLNLLVATINSLDNANISGNPKIGGEKIAFTGAEFLLKTGGDLSGILGHIFDGTLRRMRNVGNGRWREYVAAGEYRLTYNTEWDGVSYTGRDVADVCYTFYISSAGFNYWKAASAASGTAPSWVNVLTVPLTGSASFLSDAIVTLVAAQTLANKTLAIPTIADYQNATHAHTSAAAGGFLGTNAIATNMVQDNCISTLKIQANAITAVKIGGAEVLLAKLKILEGSYAYNGNGGVSFAVTISRYTHAFYLSITNADNANDGYIDGPYIDLNSTGTREPYLRVFMPSTDGTGIAFTIYWPYHAD